MMLHEIEDHPLLESIESYFAFCLCKALQDNSLALIAVKLKLKGGKCNCESNLTN